MKTLHPSGLPFSRKQPQLAGGLSGSQSLLPSSAGVAWGWMVLQVPWPAGQGGEAQGLRFPSHHPLLPLVLGSDSLWP